MKANSMFEPVFTGWLLQNLPMPKSEAIYSGAQIAGCNPVTCERYLKKLTSAAGPLNESRDNMGTATIDFKPDLKQAPTDSLEPGKLRGRGATADTMPELRGKKRDGRATGSAK